MVPASKRSQNSWFLSMGPRMSGEPKREMESEDGLEIKLKKMESSESQNRVISDSTVVLISI